MKSYFMLLVYIATFFSLVNLPAASAQTSTTGIDSHKSNLTKTDDFGLGIKWGSLTGISGKFWANENQAWDATLAFENGNTALGIDYLWHFRNGVADVTNIKNSAKFVPYLGAGLISAFGSNTKFFNRNTEYFGLAARLPMGLEFLPSSVRLGVFAELGLGFGFVPTTYTFITADIGARYYF